MRLNRFSPPREHAVGLVFRRRAELAKFTAHGADLSRTSISLARTAPVPSRLMSRLRLANLSYAQLLEIAVDAC